MTVRHIQPHDQLQLANATCGTEQCMCPKAKLGPGDPSLLNHEWCSSKAQINGTMAHITAIFGFMLAGLVLEDINANC